MHLKWEAVCKLLNTMIYQENIHGADQGWVTRSFKAWSHTLEDVDLIYLVAWFCYWGKGLLPLSGEKIFGVTIHEDKSTQWVAEMLFTRLLELLPTPFPNTILPLIFENFFHFLSLLKLSHNYGWWQACFIISHYCVFIKFWFSTQSHHLFSYKLFHSPSWEKELLYFKNVPSHL